MLRFEVLSEDECRRLASDFVAGKVFGNFMLTREQSKFLEYVFPIVTEEFIDFSNKHLSDIGLIYEYLDKASSKKIYGLPVFNSLKLLDIKTSEEVSFYLSQMKDFRKNLKIG